MYLLRVSPTTPRYIAAQDIHQVSFEFGRELRLPNDLVDSNEEDKHDVSHTEYAQQLKTRLTKAFKTAKDVLHTAHKTQKHFYDRWARADVFKEGDMVLWLDRKTRRGRCMKLNKPWTGPWRIIKRLGEVVYRIKYEGSESVGIKRRIVHHNQIKRFYEAPTLERANANVDENEDGAAEIGDEAVVVVDGPGVACPEEGEIQENNNVEEDQTEQIEGNEIKPTVNENHLIGSLTIK